MLSLVQPEGCALSPAQLAAQHDRASTLAPAVDVVARVGDELRVVFTENADRLLLQELVDTERSCCSFVEIGFEDETRRRLRVVAGNDAGRQVLDLYESLFAEAAG